MQSTQRTYHLPVGLCKLQEAFISSPSYKLLFQEFESFISFLLLFKHWKFLTHWYMMIWNNKIQSCNLCLVQSGQTVQCLTAPLDPLAKKTKVQNSPLSLGQNTTACKFNTPSGPCGHTCSLSPSVDMNKNKFLSNKSWYFTVSVTTWYHIQC